MKHFVGRRRELQRVWNELKRGRHLVLAGRHGSGRTALMRRLESLHEDEARFVFADLSQTAGAASQGIYDAVSTRRDADSGRLSYKTTRYRLLNDADPGRGPCVLVFDNITRLTKQRLDLVRDLALTRRFRIVAIAGASLAASDLEALRRCLNGASVVSVGWLTPRDVGEFLRVASDAQGFGWTADDIDGLARSLGGYPMGMVFVVDRELRKRAGESGRK